MFFVAAAVYVADVATVVVAAVTAIVVAGVVVAGVGFAPSVFCFCCCCCCGCCGCNTCDVKKVFLQSQASILFYVWFDIEMALHEWLGGLRGR